MLTQSGPPLLEYASRSEVADADHRADQLAKTYRVFQKKAGLLGAVRGLFRREYKEVRAVDGVSFTIEPGEMVALPRPQRRRQDDHAQDALRPDLPDRAARPACSASCPGSGPTPFAGSSPWSWARRTSSGGTCPPPTASSSTARSTRCRRRSSTRTLGELTELFGVEELTRQPVRELSLGERMKMELIAALLHQPQLLLLDEPTIGLDVVAQVDDPEVPARVQRQPRRDHAADQPLHARRRGAVPRACWSSPTAGWSTTAPLAGITEQFGQAQAGQAAVRRRRAPDGPGPLRRGDAAAKGRWST